MRGALFALITAFLGMSLLFSCKGKPHDPAHVTAIDSMLIQVDSLERLLNAIDVPVYLRMDSTFRTQKDRLENVMKDTLNRAQAMAVGNYFRAMSGSLGRVGNMYDETLRELADARKQLVNLKHDIGGGLLPEGPEATYVQQEQLFLSNLARKTSILLNSAGTAKRNWEEHHLLVDSLLTGPVPTP
ncbi:MAG: hypothetical protein IT229_06570 [Flavobacteriales bacterium]|nr:hypothetical protein [Flavobacteriales bacterium]